ncbi:MAG TPA: hypothetical protein P5184_08185, partial [Bacteroidales bacterium]|nr:hypothetical protein [Bacteroidales bacterium]
PAQNISHICLVLSGQIDRLRNKRRSDIYRDTVFLMESNRPSGEDLTYRASEDSLLLAINMDRVIDLMREYPGFTRRFLEWYSSLL